MTYQALGDAIKELA